MDYNEARPKIAAGDVLAFSHEGWGSWADIESQAVRIFTGSEFSHVGIAWPVLGRVLVLEAVVPMIRIYPLSKLLPFYWLLVGRKFTDAAEEYAISRVGEKYSKWEAVKGYFGATRDDRRWQCAEYVRAVLAANGLSLNGKATPADVVEQLMEIGTSMVMVTKA